MTPANPRPSASAVDRAHRLWGGRFGAASAPALEAINRSIGTDFRLWPFDVRLSTAWAAALGQAGVLSAEDSRRLELGLAAVGTRIAAGEEPRPSDEDVHTMIDRLLHDEVGDLAATLHTGRSRNDQVATATRLWCAGEVRTLDGLVRALEQVLLDHATALESALMPAYTHLQRAQPVAAAHWLLGHFWALERDRARIAAAGRSALAVLPLGSGAIAGCAYPISRAFLRERLGFAALTANSIDAVSDRDFVAELLFALSLLATHLSRLAEDFILFGSSEFGFVQFGDAYTTGSSMMPQKRNPDALELARAASGRVDGDLVALLVTLKGLPSGYNKDMQDDKRALFDATDAMGLVLPAVAGAVAEATFRTERMEAAVTSVMMATDLADYLVGKGATFREAHQAVGQLVRVADDTRCELHQLPFALFTSADARFDIDVFEALSPRRSVDRRNVEGGTGPTALRTQLDAARAALADLAPQPGDDRSAIRATG
jgi:argininosuccinate lyase